MSNLNDIFFITKKKEMLIKKHIKKVKNEIKNDSSREKAQGSGRAE